MSLTEEFYSQYLSFHPQFRCFSADVWRAYQLYALCNGHKPLGKHAFCHHLGAYLKERGCSYRKTISIDGELSSGYRGVEVRELSEFLYPKVVGVALMYRRDRDIKVKSVLVVEGKGDDGFDLKAKAERQVAGEMKGYLLVGHDITRGRVL